MRGERIPTPVTSVTGSEWQEQAAGHTGPALQGATFYGADRAVRPYGRGTAAIHMYTEKELPEGSSF